MIPLLKTKMERIHEFLWQRYGGWCKPEQKTQDCRSGVGRKNASVSRTSPRQLC